MTNNSSSKSFFSMVTDKGVTSKELTNNNKEIIASDEDRASDNDELNSTLAESSGGAELTPHEVGTSALSDPLSTESEPLSTELVNQDESAMSHDARRVLVHLMRQGSVMASQKPKLFELLCCHEMAIRKHLSEVYLQLVLDRKSGVAFVASSNSAYKSEGENNHGGAGSDIEGQEDLEFEETTTLISKRTLSLYDTLILLVLRKHYQDRESAGEQKITIDIERLESYLTPFLPITDHASKDRKKLLARVKEMVKRKVLSTIRGAEDRYEITPIIRYVVSASFLESMLAEYTALASNQTGLNDDGKRERESGGAYEK